MTLVRHSVLNLAGAVIPIFVAVPSIGLLARALDTERFGLVTLAWALVGYAGILELGISRAVTRFVAAAQKDPETHPEILSSAVTIVFGVGLLAALLVILVSRPFAIHIMKVSSGLLADCLSGLFIAALSLPLLMISLVLQGYWDGVENFVEANMQRAFGGSLIPAFSAIAAVIYPTFTGTMIGLIVARIVIILVLLVRKRLGGQLSWQAVRCARAKDLVSFGGWLTVSNAISPIMGYLDRYILAYTRGAGIVAYYAAPSEAALRLLLLPVAVTRGLFPKLVYEDSVDSRRRLARHAYVLIFATCMPTALLVALLAEPILGFWLGEQYAEASTRVLQILMIGFLASAFAQVPFTHLHAIGRPDLSAKVHAMEIVPFLAVAFWLTTALGVVGAAIAWSARNIVDLILLHYVGRGVAR